MANLFSVSITQINGAPSKQPKQYAFFSADVLILEDHKYAPNNACVLYNNDYYYTNNTAEELINAANLNSTEVFEATIINISGYQIKTPIKGGFPIKGVLLSPETTVTGANSSIVFKGKTYYAVETVDALVAESNSGVDPVTPVTGANPTAQIGLTAVNGNSTQFMRSDAAPALNPAILTQTGEANKIPQLDNGGTLVLQNSTQRTEYGANSIFMYGPNASWLDIDASGMEIDLIGGGTTIHLGLDGIDAANQPITTSHVPAADIDLINKAYFDAQIAALPDGLSYKGAWNAATNTPTLANGVGANGDYYKVSVGGTRDLGGGSVVYAVGDHLVYVAGTDNKWENFGQSAPVPANPSSTVGLTAKNGSALSFMRSDAAPAIDQAIVPTWSGIHTFNGSTGTAAPGVKIGGTNPGLRYSADNGAANNKIWDVNVLVNNAAQSSLRVLSLMDNGNGKTGTPAFAISANLTEVIAARIGTATTSIFLAEVAAGGTPGITSNSGANPWAHTGAFYNTGLLGAGVAATRPGPTNTGVLLTSTPGLADIQFFDSSHTPDNRTAEWIYFQNKLQCRFKNDSGGAAVVPIAFAGGQATGVTGIESTSGTGAWVHTGAFTKTGLDTTVTGADGVKLWLAKYTSGTGHNNAPTAIGATSNYLQVGGREYGNNGFGGIGFGYVSAPTDHPCVWVGHEEKNGAGNTSGDFLVAVRNATTNTAPTEAFRIAQNKDATFAGNLTVAGTITAAGLLGVVASDGKTAQAANVNAPSLYAVPTSGMYRVSAFLVVSQAATTSSVLPGCSVTYTEATTGVVAQDIVTLSANTNTLGLHVGGSAVISAQQGSNIGYVTSNYASAGATPMQYAVRIKIEFLG